jgi:hypothetical protein
MVRDRKRKRFRLEITDMFDDLEALRANLALKGLLAHYAEAGLADREAWQDRVMELDGARPDELVRLHGVLLANEWIEQNTGATPVLERGAVPRCYRVTAAGLRTLKRAEAPPEEEEALV